ALRHVALFLGDVVLVLRLGLVDLAGMRFRGLVLLLELGLGDLLLALGVGFAHFLLVALHRAALRLGGFVVRLDAVVLGLARLTVDARLHIRRAVGARAYARLVGGGGLRLRDAGE